MLPYLYTFGISIALCCIADNVQNKTLKLLLALAATVPLSLLAGYRSLDVGADTSNYPVTSIRFALAYNLFDTIAKQQTEWLYSAFVWFLTRFTGDVHVLLFFLQFIGAVAFAVSLYRETPRHIALGMCVYVFVVYCWSFNIIRQTTASCILPLAFSFARTKSLKAFFITIFVAIGFHNTAIMGLLFWPLCRIMENRASNSRPLLDIRFALLYIPVIVLLFSLAPRLIQFLSIFKDSYSYQLEHIGKGTVLLTFEVFIVAMILIGILLIGLKRKVSKDTHLYSLFYVHLAILPLSLLSTVSPALFRIGFMLVMLSPLYVVYIARDFESKQESFIYSMFLILFCFAVWYRAYVIGGAAGAVPYVSYL